jgi:hypothetical protein
LTRRDNLSVRAEAMGRRHERGAVRWKRRATGNAAAKAVKAKL